jgi:hypothetical protein
MRKINKDFPTIDRWTNWDMWERYCSQGEFFSAVKNAIRQDSDEFQPYPEAKGFLSTLKQNGYHINSKPPFP